MPKCTAPSPSLSVSLSVERKACQDLSVEDPLGFVFAIQEHGNRKREVVKLKAIDNEVNNNRQLYKMNSKETYEGTAIDDKIRDAQYDD